MKKEDWEAGYQAGVKRESSQAPRQFDALSWQSGYIEGKASSEPPSNWGGSRPGSGRPKTDERRRQLSITLPPGQVDSVKSLPDFENLSKFVETAIDFYLENRS